MSRRKEPAPSTDDLPVEPRFEQRIVQRPDGYHWLTADGKREVGPFATFEEAEFDLHADEHSDVEPEETLPEAEREVGITDWIDPETGEPGEELGPRLEDH